MLDVLVDKVVTQICLCRITVPDLVAKHVSIKSWNECYSQTLDLLDARSAQKGKSFGKRVLSFYHKWSNHLCWINEECVDWKSTIDAENLWFEIAKAFNRWRKKFAYTKERIKPAFLFLDALCELYEFLYFSVYIAND